MGIIGLIIKISNEGDVIFLVIHTILTILVSIVFIYFSFSKTYWINFAIEIFSLSHVVIFAEMMVKYLNDPYKFTYLYLFTLIFSLIHF